MHLKAHEELKVLTCIHRPDNVSSFLNMLDVLCPTKDNPICAYVLHLIEQIGRATPIFVSHQLQKINDSQRSSSSFIIKSFNEYAQDQIPGAFAVSIFTAISPSDMMHEDICTLALDKLANLIILPFHKIWSMDGIVEFESNMIRALNTSMLEKSPCSVAILVDHGHFGCSSILATDTAISVGVIFLGGKDDREALTLAKNMARDKRVHLTIMYLVSAKDDDDNDDDKVMEWDKMIDSEVLRSVRLEAESKNKERVHFIETMMKDGADTLSFMQSKVDEFDLFILGRRFGVRSPQTVGLGDWSEFPELGPLGDLLTPFEFNRRASVLVVQQQKMVE